MTVEVRPVEGGAEVVVDGVVRATFVGDLDRPEDRAALDELVDELFPHNSERLIDRGGSVPPD